MYLLFKENPKLDELLHNCPDFYAETLRTMWESYNLYNLIDSYGFELIRINYGSMELIVQRTLFYIKFTMKYKTKYKL